MLWLMLVYASSVETVMMARLSLSSTLVYETCNVNDDMMIEDDGWDRLT